MKISQRDLLYALLPGLALLALLLYADPRGDFPLNDDFQNAESVRGLCAKGELRLSPWALASSVAHIGLGSLTCLIASPTNERLRFLMIVLGSLLCGVFYLFLRRLSLSRPMALAGALLLAFDPLYAAMSASFHLEVTALAFQLAGLWCFLESLAPERESRSDLFLLASSAFCGLGALTRQTACLSLAGAALFLLANRRLTWRRLAALILPAGMAIAAYSAWYHLKHGPTWAYDALRPGLYAAAGWRPSQWLRSVLEFNGSLQTLALFLSPLAFAAGARLLRPAPKARELAALAAVGILAAAGWRLEGGLPLLENTFNRAGLGVVTPSFSQAKAAGWWGAQALWLFFDAAALLSALALTRLLWRRSPTTGSKEAALLAFILPPFLAYLLLSENYDRYLLCLLPGAIALVLMSLEGLPWSRPVLAGTLLFWAALTGAGLKDYFAWNRARWQAGLHGVALGVPPGRIENGFDWDGQFTLQANMDRLMADKAPGEIGMWDWMKLNRVVLITSFSPEPPLPGYVRVERFPYRTPLAPGEHFIYLHGLSSSSP